MFCSKVQFTKRQLISKADWRAIDSPKKRTEDEFDLFAEKSMAIQVGEFSNGVYKV